MKDCTDIHSIQIKQWGKNCLKNDLPMLLVVAMGLFTRAVVTTMHRCNEHNALIITRIIHTIHPKVR